MLMKLVLRNVKRQMQSYLIYFMTVILTVALLFALCNMIFSPQLHLEAEMNSGVKNGLTGLAAFISILVAFVLGYAVAFLLKFRKQEFGMYLTLGMTRNNILLIFLGETSLIGIIALGLGIVVGVFFYQGIVAVMLRLLHLELTLAAYSVQGLLVAMGLVAGIFLLSALTSAIYLKVAGIYDLLHGKQKVEKKSRHPMVWILLTALSALTLAGAASALFRSLEIDRSGSSQENAILTELFVLAAALILFHMGLAKSLVNLLLKWKKLCSSGTGTFVLRQLSANLSVNAVMIAMMAFLLTVSIVMSNGAFMLKLSGKAAHEKAYPFDITYTEETGQEGAPAQSIPPEQAEPIIQTYLPIKESCAYTLYTAGRSDLYALTQWFKRDDTYTDTYITEGDFNRLCKALGYPTVDLGGRFLAVMKGTDPDNLDLSRITLDLGGKRYAFGGKREGQSPLGHSLYAVVPDEAAEGLRVESREIGYVLKQKRYDAEGLQRALTYTDGEGFETCDYWLKEIDRQAADSDSAIFVIGAFYIGAVFLLMVMAVLALKVLSGTMEDRHRYLTLMRLGVGEQAQSRTLLRQTAAFFFLPLIFPLLSSIPTGWLCSRYLIQGGLADLTGEMHAVTWGIAAVIIVFYTLYFTAAFQIAKKSVIQRENR